MRKRAQRTRAEGIPAVLPSVGVFSAVTLALALGCGGGPVETPADVQWRDAQAMWQRRDARAWEAWRAIDPATPEGRQAHGRLSRADAHYREGIARIEAGRADAREALTAGVAIAPMDPRLYLSLARACRDRGLPARAVEYYLKLLAAMPSGPEADAARRELRSLEPELADVFAPPPVPAEARERGEGEGAAISAEGVAVAAVALLAAVALVLLALRRRGLSLARVVERHPELHPAIAYLVGSLRHELLKHRIGAVGDALRALGGGQATTEQLAFLRSRLYGGEPLREAWASHLRAFDRALGFRLDLGRDARFREAGRAIRVIAALEEGMVRDETRVRVRLARAYAKLRAFDRHLAELVRRLVRTRLDAELLRGVVGEVRAEYQPGRVELDELRVEAPEDAVEVEVFRIDLVLILKNIVRNAILAVEGAPPPRRVAVDVTLTLEPTGEEIVRVRVRDTSAEAPSATAIRERSVDRGLGLVSAALSRYDGSIDVEQGGDGYAKAITLRFFRALDDGEEEDAGREAA